MTEAWVTLATTDAYAVGAIVLAHSLKGVGTTRKLHCMITTTVSQTFREKLRQVFDEVSEVDVFDSRDSANLQLIGRPDLGITFTKINCWRLTQYTKCVFLDADCLAIQNSDELFDHEEFSAAADIGWPDCFNSGVFVFIPSEATYNEILKFALEHGSFDGGDQGLLNMYFHDWRDKPAAFRLPFIYNMTSGSIYTYAAAYKRFGAQVKIVHFLGAVKPWQQSPGSVSYSEHLTYWWSLFSKHLSSSLPSSHVSSSTLVPMLDCTAPASYTDLYSSYSWGDIVAGALPDTLSHPECSNADGVQDSSAEPESSTLSEEQPRMPIYRCIPPETRPWVPLRYLPVHLAQRIPSFLRGEYRTDDPGSQSDEERIRAWEIGHPDYLGIDSFENIKKALDEVLK